ncbi:hypothetical protein ACFPES_18000 [Paenibacillus sp. GCM10023248]|nr:hypothetical protein [Bacillus sp. 3255]MDD9268938.1 hypothetical protein [Paenibacillus sp. MAHUQ-63]
MKSARPGSLALGMNPFTATGVLQLQRTIGNKAVSQIVQNKRDSAVNDRIVQLKWSGAGSSLKWEGEWNARLMHKEPKAPAEDEQDAEMVEEPQMPSILKWDGKQYVPSAASFNSDVFPAASDKAAGYLATLKQWHGWSIQHNLTDSKDILPQIIDVIESKEEGVMVMTANNGKFLRGISLYEENGTTEGYPEIDADDRYWYVMFSAAHPATQLPREKRGVNNDGGVGTALNAAYDGLMAGTAMPIYRHAANPTSYLSLLRAGYTDVNAESDGFQVPQL